MAAVLQIPPAVEANGFDDQNGLRSRGMDISPGSHVVAAISGRSSGPTLMVIGGLHGNESAGVKSLSNVAVELVHLEAELKGRVYFIAGNTRALRRGVRFIDNDLNRSWTPKNRSPAGCPDFFNTCEGSELSELNELIDGILVTASDEVYVLDLHSTSAEGVPFATVGDTMRNRRFAQKFPVPIILGVEEQLDGTLLEYLNNSGAVTMGFEGGQHYSDQTVANHENMIWNALVNSGILADTHLLGKFWPGPGARRNGEIVEIRHRHPVRENDDFVMELGFDNFDPIVKGQVLARDRRGDVKAAESGLILMPLYQKLGEDGFFVGRRVSRFWLFLSGILRRLHIPDIVHFLPGVRRDPDDDTTLIIDTGVARLFPLQVFHLLGFRRRRWIDKKLIVSRRKHDTASPFLARK